MNTDPEPGKHDELTQRVIGIFYDVYNELGYGFLEIVYREAMRLALADVGISVEGEGSHFGLISRSSCGAF